MIRISSKLQAPPARSSHIIPLLSTAAAVRPGRTANSTFLGARPYGTAAPVSCPSTTSQRTEWLVIAPDYDDAFEKRVRVRPQHLSKVWPQVDAGLLVFGGPYLSEPVANAETPRMIGSIIIMMAYTREEVIDRLKQDIYVSEKVWNWDRVQIFPFKSTVRLGMDLEPQRSIPSRAGIT